jgi:hypothetical protein
MASLGGCRAQHAALLRWIRDVQRGSPPQADAMRPYLHSPRRCSPPEADRGSGCPRNPSVYPPRSKIRLRRNGGQGLMTIVWNAALAGFAAMTEHGPPRNVSDSRFPASARTGPVFTRTSSAGMTEERRRALPARVWGAHRSKSFPQDGTPASGGMCRGAVRLRRMPRVLGVSPNSVVSPQDRRSASGGMGGRGLTTLNQRYNRRKRRKPAERFPRMALTLACKG